MTVQDYFEESAADYDSKRSRGFLGFLRNNERKAILSFLDLRKGESLLDAGCGEGYYARLAKQQRLKAYGIDLSAKMIAKLKEKGIQGKVCDLENFSLNKAFDKIVCAGVLEFTHNPGKVLQQLANHLQPKGRLVLLYSRPSLGTFTYIFLHRLHGLRLHIISYNQLQNLLKDAGLEIMRHTKLPFFGGVASIEHSKTQ